MAASAPSCDIRSSTRPSSMSKRLNHSRTACTSSSSQASPLLTGFSCSAMGSFTSTARSLQRSDPASTMGSAPRTRTAVSWPCACSRLPISMTSMGPFPPRRPVCELTSSGSAQVCGRKPKFQNIGWPYFRTSPPSVTSMIGFILSPVAILCFSRVIMGISVTIMKTSRANGPGDKGMSCQGDSGPRDECVKNWRYLAEFCSPKTCVVTCEGSNALALERTSASRTPEASEFQSPLLTSDDSSLALAAANASRPVNGLRSLNSRDLASPASSSPAMSSASASISSSPSSSYSPSGSGSSSA
mmetsp:Transcript_39170/g.111075  ORF Transcript_39170/g.111075 Transcript_39170/m.111075 type:complete len:301 (+) Transcript_39170:155-1057(+)